MCRAFVLPPLMRCATVPRKGRGSILRARLVDARCPPARTERGRVPSLRPGACRLSRLCATTLCWKLLFAVCRRDVSTVTASAAAAGISGSAYRRSVLYCSSGFAMPDLSLFVVLPREVAGRARRDRLLMRGDVGPNPLYLGFRENPDAAWERARAVWGPENVEHLTHVLLGVALTESGLAYYSATSAGPEQRFAPLLSKQLYQGNVDWGVWHLSADLPWPDLDAEGQERTIFELFATP